MSRDVARIFADIDSMDPDKFVAHLTPDVTFRFANADPAQGRAATRDGVAAFFATISGMTHHILNTWEVGDTVIAQIDVEYVRQDGKTVVTGRLTGEFPGSPVELQFVFGLEGDRISSLEIRS